MPGNESVWEVHSAPCSEHSAWSDLGGFLFASPEWGRVVAALGATPAFAWNRSLGLGTCVGVFHRYGRRIGVFGLPVVGPQLDEASHESIADWAGEVSTRLRLDLIRVSRSRWDGTDPQYTSARPELWITALQDWDSRRSPRLHKDLAFARRAAAAVRIEEACEDPAACHRLYSNAVAAQGGSARYNGDYFAALAAIATARQRLRIFTASDLGEARGFAVLAMHGDVGYYLHGAVDLEGKKCGVGDLLLERLVLAARDAGCSRFSLMASPWNQPGLIRFKSKWADARGLAVSCDFPGGLVGRFARQAVRWQSRHERRETAAWLASRTATGASP